MPADSFSSFLAAHIETAQTTLPIGFTVNAANCQKARFVKNGKERFAFLRKGIGSGEPFFLRTPDKTKALLLAFGEKSFDWRRRPLTDLDDRGHHLWFLKFKWLCIKRRWAAQE
ncbi:hypothetical protein SBV1_370026 [Verrucomicrobia bacterium]|nr:hypothetical protein SBV1_370026 [Verrucomicrobiota bacterium]